MASSGLFNGHDTTVFSEQGMGLKADYYIGMNFQTLAGSRIDAEVDFVLSTGTAPLGVGNSYSVRWTGQIKARESADYTFCTNSDDGISLAVDGEEIIRNWTNHATTQNCSLAVTLAAGEKYDVVLEFYENGGHSTAQLMWQTATAAKEIIPQEFLYPAH